MQEFKMTKITESELKEKVNSLREYMSVIESSKTDEGVLGKIAGKALPGAGLALGIADAYNRWKKGDVTGAAISGASGVASLMPGVGTAASLGLDAYNAMRDQPTAENAAPNTAQQPVDPAMAAFFQELEKMGGTLSGAPGQEVITLPGQQPIPVAQLGQLSEAGLGAAVQAGKAALGKLPQLWANFSRGVKGALPAATQGAAGKFVAPSAANKAAWKAGQMTPKVAKGAAAAAGAAGLASMAGDTGQGAKPATTAAPKKSAQSSGAAAGYKTPEEIQELQNMLNTMGYNLKVDGIWGPKTQTAYQQAYSQMYGQQPGQTDPNQPAPQTYQQAQVAKKDLSKEMGAATGIQNPYAKPEPAAQEPAAPAQSAAPAQPGSVFGADGKITGMPAAPQPKKPGVIEYNESAELDRILQLSKLVK